MFLHIFAFDADTIAPRQGLQGGDLPGPLLGVGNDNEALVDQVARLEAITFEIFEFGHGHILQAYQPLGQAGKGALAGAPRADEFGEALDVGPSTEDRLEKGAEHFDLISPAATGFEEPGLGEGARRIGS